MKNVFRLLKFPITNLSSDDLSRRKLSSEKFGAERVNTACIQRLINLVMTSVQRYDIATTLYSIDNNKAA